MVLNAFKEVRDAIVAYNKARDIYETMAQLVHASKTNMDLAQLQYINGVIGYIDVLDAQRSYFDAQAGMCLRSEPNIRLYFSTPRSSY